MLSESAEYTWNDIKLIVLIGLLHCTYGIVYHNDLALSIMNYVHSCQMDIKCLGRKVANLNLSWMCKYSKLYNFQETYQIMGRPSGWKMPGPVLGPVCPCTQPISKSFKRMVVVRGEHDLKSSLTLVWIFLFAYGAYG